MPSEADLPAGVTRVEEPDELLPAPLVEAFIGSGEESAAPIQRVVLVASVAEGLVLDPAANLVETGVGQLHDVEGISDLAASGSIVSKARRHGPEF